MPQSLDQIMQSLAGAYNPQRDLVNQQIGALPGQQAADQAGLDTAKTNAFGGIVNSANARGVVYSGAPIDEQNKYVGEKYLPAVANLKSTYADRGTKLQSTLLGINDTQRKEAQGIQSAQSANEIAQQKAQQDQQFRLDQLNLQRQTAAASASNRAPAAKAPDKQTQFNGLLSQAFQGYDPKNKAQNFYTEKAVIPYLVQQTGLSADQVAKQVYAYRKAAFGQ